MCCSGYLREQALEDVKRQIMEVWRSRNLEEQVAKILETERNCDCQCLAVMVHPPVGAWKAVWQQKPGGNGGDGEEGLHTNIILAVFSEELHSSVVA